MITKLEIDSINNIHGKSIQKINNKDINNSTRNVINNTHISIVKMVSDEYEKLRNETVKMYTTTEVNIREFAGTSSKRISTVGINTQLIVYKNFNIDGWKRIKYDNAEYYISSKYLSDKPIEIKTETNIEQKNDIKFKKSVRTGKCIGRFKITHYAGDGITSTGRKPIVGRTIAVDPNVIPYGSKVVINGHTYIAEDCGGAIKGNVIDLFVGSVKEAYDKGVYYTEIYWG